MNRISRYCDGLMEAAWLAITFITPVFFNIDSSVTFEAPKIMLLRAIVLVALAAWGIKLISEGGIRFERIPRPDKPWQFFRIPLMLPAALMVLAYILSTIFSISPTISLIGSLYRSRSAYTLISYILLFAIIAANLRRREQLERLLGLLAAATFFVDIYAIYQKFGLDAHILQIWNFDVETRVASTIGHPIFTGAYLTMTFFILAGRAILAVYTYRTARAPQSADLLRATIYAIISILNLVAIWYTGSRGPLLGLFAGLAVFAFLLLLYWRLRRVLYAVFILGLVSAAFLVILNIPGGPLDSLRKSPTFGLLARVFELQGGTGRMRVLMWTGMSRVMSPHAPLNIPAETPDTPLPDRWNAIRPLVGYGPETIQSIYGAYYDPEMYITEGHTVTFDRSHNEFWDAMGFFGLLGTVAEYGLFLAVFYYALRWLDLLDSPFERNLYWGLALSLGFITTLALIALSQAAYLGLGVPMALLAGPLGILVYRTFRPIESTRRPEAWRALALIGFLAAIISHYVETLSGISVVATASLTWVLIGLIFITGQFPLPAEESHAAETPAKNAGRSRPAAKTAKNSGSQLQGDFQRTSVQIGALVMAMVTLGAVHIAVPQASTSAFTTLNYSLTSLSGADGPTSFSMLLLFMGTLLVAGIFLQLEADSISGRKPGWGDLFSALGLALVISIIFWLVRAAQLTPVKVAQTSGNITEFSDGIVNLLNGYCLMLLLVCLVWAIALAPTETRRNAKPARSDLPAVTGYILLPLLAVFMAVSSNLVPMQADIYYSLAKNIIDKSQTDTISAMYEKSLVLAPTQFEYYATTGGHYFRATQNLTDAAKKDNFIQLALARFKRAYQLNPLIVDNIISMARIYRLWGESTADEAARAGYFATAESFYKYSLGISNHRIDYLLDWADFSITQGDHPAALEKIERALKVDPKYNLSYAYAGKTYLAQAAKEQETTTRAALFAKAAEAYQKEIEAEGPQDVASVLAWINLGNAYQGQGKYEDALNAYSQATTLGSGAYYQWRVFAEMAKLSSLLNDPAGIRAYLQKAIEAAPAAEKPALQERLNSLGP